MTRDRQWTHARRSEVYEPATNSRLTYSNAPFGWHHTYPLLFTVPGSPGAHGRVLAAGHASQTYWLDLPAPGQEPAPGQGWQTTSGLATGFEAETAVQFRPGRILVAGGRLGTVVGTSKTLNATNLAAGWSTSQAMLPRAFHNLVLLPNGKVLALGGNGTTEQTNDAPVRKPQIWDPDGNGGMGTWTDPDALEIQPTIRGYHSTALLLPDGRVLSAGGENHPDKYLANLYCPPYLFKGESDTLATRPVVTGAPTSIRPGRHFSISVTDTTGIRRVALVRPGATTHAFDENQRYVPLTFTKMGSPACLEVSAPASLDEAPVGDYMLFVVGSKDGPDVPSIATWIRIEPPATDAVSPGKVATLTIESIARTSAAIGWFAPGDDGFTGTAQSYELKFSRDPINVCNFEAASDFPIIPVPATANDYQCIEVDGLLSCKTYYFALRATDEAGNRSLVSNVVSGTTTCSGNTYALCSGTGLMAQSGDDSGWHDENSLFAETSGTEERIVLRDAPATVSGRLVVRLRKGGPGYADLDRVSLGYVDHAADVRVYEGPDRTWTGFTGEVASVTDGAGIDRTALLTGADPSGLVLPAGTVLTVSLPSATSGTRLLVEATRDASGLERDGTGIVVERPDGPTSWRETVRIHPRRTPAPFAAPIEASATVRVRLLAPYRLRSLARLESVQGRSLSDLDLESANHSRLADVRSAVASNGGSSVVLNPGETLDAGFESPGSAPPATRTFVLEVRGAYTTSGESRVTDPIVGPVPVEIPLHFAGARPNPASGGTTFVFSHPERARVIVRVYDVRGRVLTTVLDEELDGGDHRVSWDGKDDGGRRVEGGVFFARLERQGWRSERKLVLLGP